MHGNDLSEKQRIGQRLMVGFNGTTFNDELRFDIGTLHVGGLILFARNLESPDQIQALCAAAQAYAAQCGLPPLFIAIDQEGGAVARLKPPFTQFAGNPAMREQQAAIDFARITAQELGHIGVNMNMAPVLDVAPVQGPSVMLQRVFGRDPQWVAQMGAAVIDHLQAGGIMAVAKHFPGIGRTVLDSHDDLPDLDIDLPTMESRDLIPFDAAIQTEVCGLMLSHIRYTGIDPLWPASLSIPIARDLLRGNMGFDGLVLTDDLDMGAIAKHYELPVIMAQCLAAEVDILLICHSGAKIQAAGQELLRLIQDNEELQQKSEASLARIFEAKDRYL